MGRTFGSIGRILAITNAIGAISRERFRRPWGRGREISTCSRWLTATSADVRTSHSPSASSPSFPSPFVRHAAMPGIAIWQFNEASVLALYVGFMSILVGLIEVPFLCSCMSECCVSHRESPESGSGEARGRGDTVAHKPADPGPLCAR